MFTTKVCVIRILQLVTKRQYRGAEVFAAELSALLAANGHQVWFAGLYAAPDQPLIAQQSTNIDLNGSKKAFSFDLLKKLRRLVADINPDIIQANGSDTLKYAVLLKSIYFPKKPVVYRNISMVSSWTKSGSLKTWINQQLFRRVDFVTSVGQESLDDLVKTYHYPVAQTQLIRRGIPDQVVDAAASRQALAVEFGFSPNDPLLLHVGQFSDEKNHPFMLQAFEQVRKKIPQARLIFIGEGKNWSSVRQQIAEQQLNTHVFLAGHRSPVQQWLAAADLFVLGSTIEGVPGVILEAGMQSVPSVAVNVGGVGEVVKQDITGKLLPAHDANAFANAVVELLENASLRKQLGNAARRFVEEHYSLQQCQRNFEALYQSLLNRQAP